MSEPPAEKVAELDDSFVLQKTGLAICVCGSQVEKGSRCSVDLNKTILHF